MKLTPEKLTLPDPRRDHIQGPLNAPLALLEYGDYECPACGKVHPVVNAIQDPSNFVTVVLIGITFVAKSVFKLPF